MDITVSAKHIRISPSKIRLVTQAVVGKPAEQALGILNFIGKGAQKPVGKLLKAGVAAAKNNYGIAVGSLYIKKINVDSGPIMKRLRPRAQGRADRILKRTAHITLTLAEKV